MDGEKLWQSVLAEIEVTLSTPVFKTWFSQTKLLSLEKDDKGQVVTIGAPSTYAKERLETYYLAQLRIIIENLTQAPTTVLVAVSSTKSNTSPTKSPGPLFEENQADKDGLVQAQRKAQLNPLYTFDNFIVGSSNNLAFSAAQAVAKASGRIHNPLFLYGGVGTGKTHLMHAIGNAILTKNLQTQALYASCEQFTNDLIESLKSKTTEKFRSKYRKLELLLIDDIQFISRSEYAQEEFFNTFNTLYNVNHQIVIASDRLPEEIPKLAQRLTSRFQGGVIVDIRPADLEMRIAILRTKAQEFEANVEDNAITFIAETFKDNTRELEGALKRVLAAAALTKGPVTEPFAQHILGLARKELKRRLTPRQIVEAVANHYDISMREITGKKRQHEIVVARQVAMFLLRNKLNLQYERIAEVLGGKDHTTIMYGVSKVENLVKNDGDLQGRIDEILEQLGRA